MVILLTLKMIIYLQSDGSNYVLENLDYIQYLGVTFDSRLIFDHHINEKVHILYAVQALI